MVFKPQITDQQPLRSDIYIRHALSVTSTGTRAALQPTPRPSPRLRPPAPSGPAHPAGGRPLGKVTSASRSCSPSLYALGPGALGCCLRAFCPAQHRSGGRLKPVHFFSNNGVPGGEQNI